MEWPITVHDVNGQPLSQLEVLANKPILGTVEGSDVARKLIEIFRVGPEIEEHRSLLPTALGDFDQTKKDLMEEYSRRIDKQEGIYYPTGMLYGNVNERRFLPQIYGLSAVNTALDELGITEIRTISPEDVMGLIRANIPLSKEVLTFPFAVLLYSPDLHKQWLQEQEKGEGLYAPYIRLAEHLYSQLKDFGVSPEEEDIPLFISGLKAYPDRGFEKGIRLDFTEKSIAIPAPAMPRPYRHTFLHAERGDDYRTESNQTIEDVLKGQKRGDGDLFILASLVPPSPIHAIYFDRIPASEREPPVDVDSIEIKHIWLPYATPVLLSKSCNI